MYGLPKNVCGVPVIPVRVYMLFRYVCLCFCMSDSRRLSPHLGVVWLMCIP